MNKKTQNMRYFIGILSMVGLIANSLYAQKPDFEAVKKIEHRLADVMEIIDTVYLKQKLVEVENTFKHEPNALNKARLGIIYHEVALNLSFFSQTNYKGYAQKSYEVLSEMDKDTSATGALMPFVNAYRASALSLVSAETRELKLLGKAFDLFEEAVAKYSDVCYAPEFMRGSVAENLPWFFFGKRKFAKKDFQSIINKQQQNNCYANWKIMSFTYWAWANQYQGQKHREQALLYLERAIALDPDYKAGRERAEKLKEELHKK